MTQHQRFFSSTFTQKIQLQHSDLPQPCARYRLGFAKGLQGLPGLLSNVLRGADIHPEVSRGLYLIPTQSTMGVRYVPRLGT